MKAKFQLPPPEDWVIFEQVCLRVWGLIWQIPDKIDMNSTNAQGQDGVDIVGVPKGETKPHGIQGKNKRLHFKGGQLNKLTKSEINVEIEKAKKFRPALGHLVIATSLYRDKEIEEYVRECSQANQHKGLFSVQICFWEFISDQIQQNRLLLNWYLHEQDLIGQYDVEVLLDNSSIEKTFHPEFTMDVQIHRQQTQEEYNEEVEGFGAAFKKAYKELNKSLPLYHRVKNNVRSLIPQKNFKKGDVTILINGQPPKLFPRKKEMDQIDLFNETYDYKPVCPFKIYIKNTGSKVIENYKLEFELLGSFQDFDVEGPTITQGINKTYQTHSRKISNNQGRIRPSTGILVQQDTFESYTFFFHPQMIGDSVVTIKWKLIARDFNTQGTLSLVVKPHYEKKESIWYIAPGDQAMTKCVFTFIKKKGGLHLNI
jgi:hypothetical protein